MRGMLVGEDGVIDAAKFLDDISAAADEGIEAMVELASNRVTKAVDNALPTVAEQIEAGVEINAFVRGVSYLDDKIGGVWRTVNRFFAGVYMGLNPGYAFRNLLTNTFHIAIEEGLEAGLEAAAMGVRGIFHPETYLDNTLAEFSKWTGGQVPEFVSKGFGGPVAAIDEAGTFGFAARWSQRFESAGSATTSLHALRTEMHRAIRALPVDELIEAGLKQVDIDWIKNLIRNHYGNVDDAFRTFANSVDAGGVEIWRSISQFDPTDVAFLEKIGADVTLREVLETATTKEEILGRIDDMVQQLYDEAAKVTDEIPNVPIDDISEAVHGLAIEDTNVLDKLVKERGLLGWENNTYVARQSANENAIGRMTQATQNAVLEAKARVGAGTDEFLRLDELYTEMNQGFDSISTQASLLHNDTRNAVLALTDRLNAGPNTQAFMRQIWQEAGLGGRLPSLPSKKVVSDMIWRNYWMNYNRQYWGAVRDMTVFHGDEIMQRAINIAGMDDYYDISYTWAQKYIDDAMKLDTGVMAENGLVHLDPSDFANRNAITQMAFANNVPTASRLGVASDRHLVNLINAELGTVYNNINDIPYDIARRAFAQKYGDDFIDLVDPNLVRSYLGEGAPPQLVLTAEEAAQLGVEGFEVAEEAVEVAEEALRTVDRYIDNTFVDEVIGPIDVPVQGVTSRTGWMDNIKVDWMRDNLQSAYTKAEQRGLISQIHDWASQRMTSNQMTDELIKLGYDQDTARNMISAVRGEHGIPSAGPVSGAMGGMPLPATGRSFDDWLKEYQSLVTGVEDVRVVDPARVDILVAETERLTRVVEDTVPLLPEGAARLIEQEGITFRIVPLENERLVALMRSRHGRATAAAFVDDGFIGFVEGTHQMTAPTIVHELVHMAEPHLPRELMDRVLSISLGDGHAALAQISEGVMLDRLNEARAILARANDTSRGLTSMREAFEEFVEMATRDYNDGSTILRNALGDSYRRGYSEAVTYQALMDEAGMSLSEVDAWFQVDTNLRSEILAIMSETSPSVRNTIFDFFAPEKVVPPYDGGMMTFSRMISEQMPEVEKMAGRLRNTIDQNYGQTHRFAVSEEADPLVRQWFDDTAGRMTEARVVSQEVARHARDFALLDYTNKRYIDLVLAYMFPYQFWYSRTYLNWVKRLARPELWPIVAGYGKYRDMMADMHSDLPDWWKYNINSNELLGIDMENPLFFNLESTINPLHGLTGVDFEDPKKRTNWWTAFLDDLGRFGPSTWTPFSAVTAMGLYLSGEEEAAARWGGRLIPQTATIKSITNILGVGPPGGAEYDPFVHFFGGGIGVYERRRVGRALGQMVEEGLITSAEAQDAAYYQEGDIWDQGLTRATESRQWGQIASQFLGVGFRARPQSDQEIDQFYTEYFRLWAFRPNLSPEEFRQAMTDMHIKYPFMDTVLLSRKAGMERDAAFAYNVLGRVPPGQSGDITEWAGIDERLVEKFYNDKGDMSTWEASDRDRFMAGIVDIAAVLDVPDSAAQQEWTDARIAYSEMTDRQTQIFGEDVQDKITIYFAFNHETEEGRDAAYAFMAANPEVSQAMDWRGAYVLTQPLLAAYYGSIETIQRFYTGMMYDDIETKLGTGIWDLWDEYWRLKDTGGDSRSFWNAHTELAQYGDIKDAWEEIIAQRVIELGHKLPEGMPPFVREGIPESIGAADLVEQLQQQQQQVLFPLALWQAVMSRDLLNAIVIGEDLSEMERSELIRVSAIVGMPPEAVIAYIRSVAP